MTCGKIKIRLSAMFALLLALIFMVAIASLATAAADDDCSGTNNCRWQELGTLSMEKTSQSSIGDFIFQARDYDGNGSVELSFYNTSGPNATNNLTYVFVTEGEYSTAGDLRFYGERITNTNDATNRMGIFGLWPCCPRATIDVSQKTWITPTETGAGGIKPAITFSVSGSTANSNAFLIGQQIPYTITIRSGNSNIKNLSIVLDTAGLQLLMGETKMQHTQIYSSESLEHSGVFMASTAGQLSPGIEWSYTDADNNNIEGSLNVPITIRPPIKVSKYYPAMLCTGQDIPFSIGIENLEAVPVNVNLTDALPDGFYPSGNDSFKKEFHLQLGPGETRTVAYAAEPKIVGIIQVLGTKALWTFDNFKGIEDTNAGTIKVYGPVIVVSKTAVIKNDINDNNGRNETIGVAVKISNQGDTMAYVEVTDVVPLNLSEGKISGSAVYKGNVEAGGTKNISYEFYHDQEDGIELNLSEIMDTAPKIKVYASKFDSMDPEMEHAYSSAYIFKKHRSTATYSGIDEAEQEQPRSANRNPSIVFNDIYTSPTNMTNPESTPEPQTQSQYWPRLSWRAVLEKIYLFFMGIVNRI